MHPGINVRDNSISVDSRFFKDREFEIRSYNNVPLRDSLMEILKKMHDMNDNEKKQIEMNGLVICYKAKFSDSYIAQSVINGEHSNIVVSSDEACLSIMKNNSVDNIILSRGELVEMIKSMDNEKNNASTLNEANNAVIDNGIRM